MLEIDDDRGVEDSASGTLVRHEGQNRFQRSVAAGADLRTERMRPRARTPNEQCSYCPSPDIRYHQLPEGRGVGS